MRHFVQHEDWLCCHASRLRNPQRKAPTNKPTEDTKIESSKETAGQWKEKEQTIHPSAKKAEDNATVGKKERKKKPQRTTT
jgi:hypothetical protein